MDGLKWDFNAIIIFNVDDNFFNISINFLSSNFYIGIVFLNFFNVFFEIFFFVH